MNVLGMKLPISVYCIQAHMITGTTGIGLLFPQCQSMGLAYGEAGLANMTGLVFALVAVSLHTISNCVWYEYHLQMCISDKPMKTKIYSNYVNMLSIP